MLDKKEKVVSEIRYFFFNSLTLLKGWQLVLQTLV